MGRLLQLEKKWILPRPRPSLSPSLPPSLPPHRHFHLMKHASSYNQAIDTLSHLRSINHMRHTVMEVGLLCEAPLLKSTNPLLQLIPLHPPPSHPPHYLHSSPCPPQKGYQAMEWYESIMSPLRVLIPFFKPLLPHDTKVIWQCQRPCYMTTCTVSTNAHVPCFT
jgi:hypothetical protein